MFFDIGFHEGEGLPCQRCPEPPQQGPRQGLQNEIKNESRWIQNNVQNDVPDTPHVSQKVSEMDVILVPSSGANEQ